MALIDVIRSGLKTADKVTKSLQCAVTYQRVMTRNGYGDPATYSAATTLKGIVDFRAVPVRDKNGVTVYSSATITFLDVAEISTKTSGQGVDVDDVFTLPDGTKGKVLSVGGFMDAGTTKPLPTTVMLG